mgnify:CR=1 FL=1
MAPHDPEPTVAQELVAALSPTADELAVRSEELARRAADEGLLDIAWSLVSTGIGTLLLAATDQGLVRVTLPNEPVDPVLDHLAEQLGPRLMHTTARVDRAADELVSYLAGDRRSFDVPLDLALSHGYRRGVLAALCDVPYGATVSYAALAASTSSPRAVRAAASACATNPLPLFIPCHRVVRSDGSIGNYGGGPDLKRRLLDLERPPGEVTDP